MTLQHWIIFATLLLALIIFITGRWRYDVVTLLALITCCDAAHHILLAARTLTTEAHASYQTAARVAVTYAVTDRQPTVAPVSLRR